MGDIQSQCDTLSGWESLEELKHSILYTTMEMEQTKMVFQQELKMRDDQLSLVEARLAKVLKERDDAHLECKRLLLENLQLQQHLQQSNAPASGVSSIEDEPIKRKDSNNGFSSSDCDESSVSPPTTQAMNLVSDKPLPEKGKLLQAVMKAGPLLKTLLLAGPLPQWKYPPPPLESVEIPPISISVSAPPHRVLHHEPPVDDLLAYNKKRLMFKDSVVPNETKHARIALL